MNSVETETIAEKEKILLVGYNGWGKGTWELRVREWWKWVGVRGEGLRLSLSRTSGGHNWTCRNTY